MTRTKTEGESKTSMESEGTNKIHLLAVAVLAAPAAGLPTDRGLAEAFLVPALTAPAAAEPTVRELAEAGAR